jgi:hypothetical protein
MKPCSIWTVAMLRMVLLSTGDVYAQSGGATDMVVGVWARVCTGVMEEAGLA